MHLQERTKNDMSENRELLPELLTKRLILRQYTELDLDALFVLLSDREVNTFLPWFPVKTREEALQFLREHFLIPGQSVLHTVMQFVCRQIKFLLVISPCTARTAMISVMPYGKNFGIKAS